MVISSSTGEGSVTDWRSVGRQSLELAVCANSLAKSSAMTFGSRRDATDSVTSVTQYNPYVIPYEKDGRMRVYGIIGSVVDNVTSVLNVSYTLVLPEDGMWGAIQEDGSYNGMLKMVHEKKADIALGPITPDAQLMQDFHQSAVNSHIYITIMSGMKHLTEANSLGILQAFDLNVNPLYRMSIPHHFNNFYYTTWLFISLSIVLLSFFAPCFQVIFEETGPKVERRFWKTLDFIWTSISALLRQGVGARRWTNRTKIAFGAWLISTLVLMTSFTSLIVATLTVRLSAPRIDSIEDLVAQPHLYPVVPKATQLETLLETSKSEVYKKLHQMVVQHNSLREIPDLYNPVVIRDIVNEKAILLLDRVSPKLHLSQLCPSLHGYFHLSKEYVYLWNNVWPVNKDLPKRFHIEMDKRIKWWVEGGVPTMRPYELHPPRATCFVGTHGDTTYSFATMGFKDLTTVFYLYLILSGAAFVVFLLEIALGKMFRRAALPQ
ncbi:glutamate receptor ionotropic, kainate 3-like [Ornithodoros turicata]|uniref:glutamate receptor ionotropic, kainate 3-like n=1 Tax=Ornithodoros turicata TaxID=34597 RepID=UPI00313940BA